MSQTNKVLASILILWGVLLSTGILYLVEHLKLVTDLSQFIPSYRTSNNNNQNLKFLLDEIEKGDAATLLMMEISGSSSDKVAALSRSLRRELVSLDVFSSVNNGEFSGSSKELKELFKYRYLLQSTDFTASSLKLDFKFRINELQRGLGMALKQTLIHDPQNNFINYLKNFQQRGSPLLQHGVWFDKSKNNAILIARMKAEKNSLDDQANNLLLVEKAWQLTADTKYAKLTISGPATFAVSTKNEIQKTTNRLAIIAIIFMVLIFWFGYRSIRLFFIAGIPLVSAITGALSITNLVFGNVHGITIAFGITILGVCLDYPVHLFSHLEPGQSAKKNLQAIWPTLRLGVSSTVLGYLAMLNTGFSGLSQLAIFASSGLIIALLVTRWIVPLLLIGKNLSRPVLSWIPQPGNQLCPNKCRAILVIVTLSISFYVFQFSYKEHAWQNDIAALSPIPKKAREFDQHLRDSLGLPDVGHIFIIRGENPERVLQKTEQIKSVSHDLIVKRIVKNIYSVTDQLPSQKRQKQYQQTLPTSSELRGSMLKAIEGTPFKSETFEPFINDVQTSRSLAPLTIEEMKSHDLTASLTRDMFQRNGAWVSIIRLAGVKENIRLGEWINQNPDLLQYYLDIRQTSSVLVNDYRDIALERLVIGILLMLITLVLFLKSLKKAFNIFIPVLLALLFSITSQVISGVQLTIFHILALLLVVGIGLDYSLFFQRLSSTSIEQKKNFHGVMISAASTVVAFAMLALSGVPVMAAMGVTVTLGIIASFVYSWLWITPIDHSQRK